MCGLIGSLNSPNLLPRLRRLAHRGYDSWGLGSLHKGSFHVGKDLGKIPADLVTLPGPLQIGHCRWASVGAISLANTHPIFGGFSDDFTVLVAHNGTIYDHEKHRRELLKRGYEFQGETDTEVLAHYLSYSIEGEGLIYGLDQVLKKLDGQYAFLALVRADEDCLVMGSRGVPLYYDKNWVASEVGALDSEEVFRVENAFGISFGDDWILRQKDGTFYTSEKVQVGPIQKNEGGSERMLAEILSQPNLLQKGAIFHTEGLKQPDRIWIFGCGSSLNAGLLGKKYLEEFAGIPCEVYHSCEVNEKTFDELGERALPLAITQSGETRDTLNAIQRLDYPALAITNRPLSEIWRKCPWKIDLNCGQEIAVAATKTFTATLGAFLDLCFNFTFKRPPQWHTEVSDAIEEVLELRHEVKRLAEEVNQYGHVLILGRGYDYPVALEGALKLKEVAYVHAEALHAAEMKHGPIALIDKDTLSIFLVMDSGETDRVMANLEEIRARGGRVVVITHRSDIGGDVVLRIPVDLPAYLCPFPAVVVFQLLSWEIATLRGHDPDTPKNLAKCVTVE